MYVCVCMAPARLQGGHAVHRHAKEHYLTRYQLRLLGILFIHTYMHLVRDRYLNANGSGGPDLLLRCALEHGVHEAAEHDEQLLLVDVPQPQCRSGRHNTASTHERRYVCMEGKWPTILGGLQERQIVSDVSAHCIIHLIVESSEVHILDELARHLHTYIHTCISMSRPGHLSSHTYIHTSSMVL